jgi:hypothetical protein
MRTKLYKSTVPLSLCLSILLALLSYEAIRAQYVPPDYYADPYNPVITMVPNRGQVKSLAGGDAPEVVAYTTGTVPQLYMMKETMMRVVWRELDTIPSTLDTIYAMDVSLLNSVKKDPIQMIQKDFHYNFYLPHCPPGGVEFVEGYNRTVYEGVYEGIDMHIYSGSLGMKMAFVIHPGADPSDLQLKFTGLDSLRYDMLGSIKAMLEDKFILLPEAVAYQIDVNNNIIPVGWTADYQVDAISSVAGFICPEYDELKPLVLQIGLPPLGIGGNVDGVCWSTYWNGEDMSTATDVVFVPGGTDPVNGDAVLDAQYYTGKSFSAFADFPSESGVQYAPENPSSTIYLSKFEDTRARWTNYHGISTGTHSVSALTPCGNFGVALGGTTLQGGGMEEFGPPGSFLGTGSAAGYLARFDRNSELIWCTRFHTISDMAYESGRLVAVGQLGALGSLFAPVEQPPGSASFPALPPQPNNNADAYVAVFDDSNQLRWSTRVGGSMNEDHARVAIHAGRIAMAGSTMSQDLPAILDGGVLAYDQDEIAEDEYPGDMYLLRFNPFFALEWGTFVGGPGSSETPALNKGLAILPQSGNVLLLCMGTEQTVPYEPGVYWSTPPPPTGVRAGLLMEFHGTTRQLLYSTFLNGGSSYALTSYSVAVSEYDDIYLSGMMEATTAVTFDATEFPGLYFDADGYGTRDGFILWLSPLRDLKWYTRFGGESGSSLETVGSVAIGKGTLYTTGVTRADFSQGQFFPLVDPGAPAYFSPIGNQQNSSFIATFCDLLPSVGVPEHATGTELTISTTTNHMVLITGLKDDQHPYTLYDAQGRTVAQGVVRATAGQARIALPDVVPALYVLRIADHAAQVLQLPNR